MTTSGTAVIEVMGAKKKVIASKFRELRLPLQGEYDPVSGFSQLARSCRSVKAEKRQKTLLE